MFGGRAFFAFIIRFDFVESFCETGFVGFHVSVVVVVELPPVDDESPLVEVPVVEPEDVEFVVELAVVVVGDFLFDFELEDDAVVEEGVVFFDEPFVLVEPEVVGFADEPFDLV